MSRNFELLQKIGREQSLYATTAEEPMQEMEPASSCSTRRLTLGNCRGRA